MTGLDPHGKDEGASGVCLKIDWMGTGGLESMRLMGHTASIGDVVDCPAIHRNVQQALQADSRQDQKDC